MPGEHRPPEGNVINLHEVDRYRRFCNFTDRMTQLQDLLDDLNAQGIGTLTLVADGETGGRYLTGISKKDLIDGLVKFFHEEPDIHRAVLIEMIKDELKEKEFP